MERTITASRQTCSGCGRTIRAYSECYRSGDEPVCTRCGDATDYGALAERSARREIEAELRTRGTLAGLAVA